MADPIPLETLVRYHGSQGQGLFRVVEHNEPVAPPGVTEAEMLGAYPDGVAYRIWPEGLLRKMDNRHHSVFNVRRGSLEVVK